MIEYLLCSGCINDSYERYMSNFYPTSVSSADREVLRQIVQHSPTDPMYEFDRPARRRASSLSTGSRRRTPGSSPCAMSFWPTRAWVAGAIGSSNPPPGMGTTASHSFTWRRATGMPRRCVPSKRLGRGRSRSQSASSGKMREMLGSYAKRFWCPPLICLPGSR